MVFHSHVINSCILLILLHGKETVNKHFYFQSANRSSHFEAGIDTLLDALISDSTLCFPLSICCHFSWLMSRKLHGNNYCEKDADF